MKKLNNITLVSGLALFSMFFGAGNLIFPPTIGLATASDWIIAMIGFLTTGVGLVMITVVATTKAGGSINNLAGKVSPLFAKIFSTAIILCIGPGLAIPRTAATSYEIIQSSLMPNLSPILSSIIFFAIVLFFVVNPMNIIDRIGKILTPMLLIVLFLIISKGIISPLGVPTGSKSGAFAFSFEGGYQTMDVLAALIFTTMIIKGFENKGITEVNQLNTLTIKSSFIAGFGLCIVYGGLVYIGATVSSLNLNELSKVELLTYITHTLLGTTGNVLLALAMLLACITTAIGLLSTSAQYFTELTKNKLSYLAFVIIFTLFSAYFAVKGVENIIAISAPVLVALYPVSIVLVISEFFRNKIKSKNFYYGAVLGAFYPTILTILSSFGVSTDAASKLFIGIPDVYVAFNWILPSIVLAFVFNLFGKKSK
ncbi:MULTISPECIES: branched-chain amino acid transport system II carrier protein [Peptoniphilus]|uniref:branched-chain amino acid transport system II carrier protein n=1 Tax=Peptoniphilus TaxID=162289 RepID=UPI0002E8DF59|nr:MULTISPECIES: branched-chain amino acid transport system II carrier protein [Peptoniphilus]